MTDGEFDEIFARAVDCGLSASELMRQGALAYRLARTGDGTPDVVLVDALTWLGIRRELNRWGVNHNQAVRAINRCALSLEAARGDGAWDVDALAEAVASVEGIRTELAGVRAGLASASEAMWEVASKAHLAVRRLPPGAPREGTLL